ncbi:hypothetical protein HN587_07800 [Candidatus Woesearchaeota archaeon]|jgi:hypothetical protein|nr:hypothetical protein [Candidatus Woesearchaeota archaeon]
MVCIKHFLKNKKAQYYLFTAVLLIVLAMLILKPNSGIKQTRETFTKLKSNFEIETPVVINHALVSGENLTSEFKSFETSFRDFSRLNGLQIELFYVLVNGDERFIVNEMFNQIVIVELNQTLNRSEELLTTNNAVEEKVSVLFYDDENNPVQYVFDITDEPHQLAYLMKSKRGDNIRIFKNEI